MLPQIPHVTSWRSCFHHLQAPFEMPTGVSIRHANLPITPSRGWCRPPVLLQHGLLESSVVFVDNGPRQSLAFALADAGFDVWMSNT